MYPSQKAAKTLGGNKKMNKIRTRAKTLLTSIIIFSSMAISGCTPPTDLQSSQPTISTLTNNFEMPVLTAEEMKIGFIYIGSANDEGYSQAHDMGRQHLENSLGISTMYVENIPENADAEKVARDLIDQGCNVIVANSFGYMEYILNVAEEFPEVYFLHDTGITTANNISTLFGRIYEPRYLSGIAAGLKTANGKIGYVAAFPIPEVIRGINAFTLGVQSVNPNAEVEVIWTNTWYDPATEKAAAIELLNRDCDVLAQHQDTAGPQIAAQERGAFAIGYSMPTYNAAPEAYLTAPLFNWGTIYENEIKRILDGTWESRAYWGSMAEGSVELDELSKNNAEMAEEIIEIAKEKIISGELYIFEGPLKDNTGMERLTAGQKMTDEEMLSFDWFVEGVVSTIQ